MASRKTKTSWIVWLRRIIQTLFLLLFFYLFLETVYHPIDQVVSPVTFFFEIDPLVLMATYLSTHAVPTILLLSLITLAATIIFGRWFCGWICPFGVLHHFFTSLRQRKIKTLIQQGTYAGGQKIKYYILIGFLAGAILGINAIGWLDPFSFFYRSMATTVYPAVNWGMETFFNWVYETDPGIGPLHATAVTEPVYDTLRDTFLANKQPVYIGGVFIGFLFLLIVGLNFYRGRFWCRYLCPLGALLGVAGKNPIVRLNKDAEQCHDCQLCITDCQGGAEPQTTDGWKPSECFFCFNCRDACATQAISITLQKPDFMKSLFGWLRNFVRTPKAERIDLSRRTAMTSGLGGVLGVLLFGSHPLSEDRSFNPALIRPPGACPENDFLAKCIKCGECMKVCPVNGIQPAVLQAGLEGIWTPVLNMKIGYCEHECTLCSQVCPTDAIRETYLKEMPGGKYIRLYKEDSLNQKSDTPEEEFYPIKIGQAFFDPSRCLPYAFARSCIVCEEHCPTSPKAIWVKQVTDTNSAGETVTLKRPYVDPDRCIGCGICEYVCPLKDRSGIYVTSAGETRNPKNQFLLTLEGIKPQDSEESSSELSPYGNSSLNPYP